MHELAFADAARPERAVILRLPMLDYSIGHELLLLHQRSAVLLSSELFDALPLEQKVFAVSRACLICSQSWQGNKRPHRWLSVWRWFNRNTDYMKAAESFRTYREAGSSTPATLRMEGSQGRDLGSPELALLLNYTGGNYDAPLGETRWRYYSHCEAEGLLRVENATEQQIRTEIEQHQKDYEREQLAKGGK